MIVREIEDADLLDRLGKSSGPRSAGLHISDVYKVLMKRLQPARFDKRDKQGNSLPMDMQRVEIGLLFENMLERALAEKFGTVRPGEIFSDEGIAMSPDGVNPTESAGEEFKSTFMSSRDGIFEIVDVGDQQYHIMRDKFVHWAIQMKAYAKWLGTRIWYLRVLFICGDYSRPIQPQFKSYRIEFTQEEIDQNWAMLMTVAREEGLL